MLQDDLYKKFLAQGYSQKDAAKEAQARTGVSMVSGQPIKQKQVTFSTKGFKYGQQDPFYRKGKGRHFGQGLATKSGHGQTIHAHGHTGTVGHPRIQSRQKVLIKGQNGFTPPLPGLIFLFKT